jgi:branched-chain amino acid transport system ATP-binding protein
LTVQENLKLGFLQAPRRSAAASRLTLEATYARFPQLRERRAQLGTTLSGGEQQMLAMARVIVGEPKLLLVDEPSEGLAPMVVRDIYSILAEMKQAGRAILLVEQNVMQALQLCDRFVTLERGQIVFAGDPKIEADCDHLLSIVSV